jgi:hypothetical protein
MKFKQLTFLMALTALLLNTSCTNDDDPYVGTVPVTFIAHLPETIESRAIGDGSKANELFFWVYDEDGHEYVELRQKNLEFDQTNTSRVTAHLIPGHTYKFAFWAQSRGNSAYDPDNSNIVQLYYEGAKCNDELRDAFYGWIPNLTVSAEGNVTQDIILTRRLAQLNVGLSLDGYENARAAGFDMEDFESEITVSNEYAAAYSGFNLTTGGPELSDWSYEVPEILFAKAPHPTERLNAEEKEWEYLALNYFLPTVDDYTLVTVTMKLTHKTDPTKVLGPFTYPNIKVKGHERTNILINSITSPTIFRVIIDENFDNLDNNINFDENQ